MRCWEKAAEMKCKAFDGVTVEKKGGEKKDGNKRA
jgi:hypothetical protein